ncbi:YetF domain-containing protein [Halobacillus sp. K22]|uniref:YetF domain-containing protein n=1 Tax=Halobacillus sp. K22 TaxID=3457431 RepID=UPI003FCCEB1D
MDVTELLIRLVLAFTILLVLTRIMGRKEISQLTFFNFVSAISIGTIGASLAIDASLSVRNGLIALVSWALFTVFLGYMDIKSKDVRSVIDGHPLIVVKQGKVLEGALKKARLDLDSLHVLLRKKNVFSINEVDYAIFETDGTLSVMKKTGDQPFTKKDANAVTRSPAVYPIPTTLVSDGKIVEANLQLLNIDQKWLHQQLKSAGVLSISDVFYAEVQKDGSLYVDQRNDSIH